jgi:hypothetical protein
MGYNFCSFFSVRTIGQVIVKLQGRISREILYGKNSFLHMHRTEERKIHNSRTIAEYVMKNTSST